MLSPYTKLSYVKPEKWKKTETRKRRRKLAALFFSISLDLFFLFFWGECHNINCTSYLTIFSVFRLLRWTVIMVLYPWHTYPFFWVKKNYDYLVRKCGIFSLIMISDIEKMWLMIHVANRFVLPGFLPSSFSMYGVTLSSALFLFDKPAMAVSVAAAGVILGWPFSILVVAPVTCYCLLKRFKQVFFPAAATSVVVLVR